MPQGETSAQLASDVRTRQGHALSSTPGSSGSAAIYVALHGSLAQSLIRRLLTVFSLEKIRARHSERLAERTAQGLY